MQRALPNPWKKLFPVQALQLPAVALAAPLRSLAPLSLRFLYIQNNGIFPKSTGSCCQQFWGSPCTVLCLCRGLRSREVCSNVPARMLSRSPRETSVSADLRNKRIQGFVHHTWALKLGPTGSLDLLRGSWVEVRPQGASEGSKTRALRKVQMLRSKC